MDGQMFHYAFVPGITQRFCSFIYKAFFANAYKDDQMEWTQKSVLLLSFGSGVIVLT